MGPMSMVAPAARRPVRSLRAAAVRRCVALALFASLAFACGPTNRRGEVAAGTPTPTPTASPSPSPSPTPSASPTPRLVQAFVRVEGTAGTPFVGQVLDGSGSRTVDGVIPQDFVLGTPRSFISATFSKTAEGLTTLTVRVFVDGVAQAEQSTTTNFGSVTVNVPLP